MCGSVGESVLCWVGSRLGFAQVAVCCPCLTVLCCCSISITTSCYPLPSICFRDPVSDWFESLAECLHWNVRKKQNNFAVEEEEF